MDTKLETILLDDILFYINRYILHRFYLLLFREGVLLIDSNFVKGPRNGPEFTSDDPWIIKRFKELIIIKKNHK